MLGCDVVRRLVERWDKVRGDLATGEGLRAAVLTPRAVMFSAACPMDPGRLSVVGTPRTLQSVMEKIAPSSTAISPKVVDSPPSPREQDVLRLVAQGLISEQIGHSIAIGERAEVVRQVGIAWDRADGGTFENRSKTTESAPPVRGLD